MTSPAQMTAVAAKIVDTERHLVEEFGYPFSPQGAVIAERSPDRG